MVRLNTLLNYFFLNSLRIFNSNFMSILLWFMICIKWILYDGYYLYEKLISFIVKDYIIYIKRLCSL